MILPIFLEDTHLNEFHSCSRFIGLLALLVGALESLFLLMVVLKLLFPIPGENLSSIAFKQLWRNMLKPVEKKRTSVVLHQPEDQIYF